MSPWEKIFKEKEILKHNFKLSPYYIKGNDIKNIVKSFPQVNQRELRIICKQDAREDRPKIFSDNNLFLLPTKNGHYCIVLGEGYVDVPEVKSGATLYKSKLDFELETSKVGNSEMQHLDYAYANSMLRTFMEDPKLILTIRGRKYTPNISFIAGKYKHRIDVCSVQTEIDAGYESDSKVVLVEAKNSTSKNTIIRQLFYPFKQWSAHTNKPIHTVFFEKRNCEYNFWEFVFEDPNDYNSIKLVKSQKFLLT